VSYSLDLLLYQYRDSPKLKALFSSLLGEYDTLYPVAESLLTRLDIDASVGAQLDGIGEIVGRPRPQTEEIDPDDVFAFDGGDGQGFSGIGRADIGGRWQGVDGLIIGAMPDADYRLLLKATIYSNYAESTIDALGQYITFVLGQSPEIDPGIGFVDITYPFAVSNVERRILLDGLPLAAGIRVGNEYFLATLVNENDEAYELSDGSTLAVRQALGVL
jgi:hypothetical protein